MNELKLWIPMEPEAKQSFKFTTKGRKYQPKDVVNYKDNIKFLVISQLPKGHIPYTKALKVEYEFRFPYLKGHSQKKRALARLYKTTKPDTDNLQKSINDALNGTAWIDDAQIVVGSFVKFYSDTPGTHVTIMEFEN